MEYYVSPGSPHSRTCLARQVHCHTGKQKLERRRRKRALEMGESLEQFMPQGERTGDEPPPEQRPASSRGKRKTRSWDLPDLGADRGADRNGTAPYDDPSPTGEAGPAKPPRKRNVGSRAVGWSSTSALEIEQNMLEAGTTYTTHVVLPASALPRQSWSPPLLETPPPPSLPAPGPPPADTPPPDMGDIEGALLRSNAFGSNVFFDDLNREIPDDLELQPPTWWSTDSVDGADGMAAMAIGIQITIPPPYGCGGATFLQAPSFAALGQPRSSGSSGALTAGSAGEDLNFSGGGAASSAGYRIPCSDDFTTPPLMFDDQTPLSPARQQQPYAGRGLAEPFASYPPSSTAAAAPSDGPHRWDAAQREAAARREWEDAQIMAAYQRGLMQGRMQVLRRQASS